MTDQTFRTSSDATIASQNERTNRLSRAITAKRSDRLIRGLREQLSLLREADPNTPPALQFGYGLIDCETDRVFREIDEDGFLHLVDVISGDEIDGVLVYIIESNSPAFVYPGDFPGQLRADGEIFSGRFKDNGSQIRLFKGDQTASDPDLVSQTSVDAQFIGTGISYVWTRLGFIEGRFSGDPTIKVIARSRKIIDPRDSILSPTLGFEALPKTFSINPYRFVFDYLIRPKNLGGAGVPVNQLDIQSFVSSTIWSEILVDVQQFTKIAILTTRSNQTLGTPPINTNHLLEFDETVLPFQYGDVVEVSAGPGQTLPPNLTSGTEYHVVPVRHAVGDFQIPAIALADSLEDSLNGITIAQGTRVSDIQVKKVKEIRFQSGFTYRSGDRILEQMLESCGARLYLNDGLITITNQTFPEAADIETVSTDDLFGSISLSTRLETDERATALTGSYRGLLNLFIARNYPSVSGNGVFEQEDGERLLDSFNLPLVPKASTAQRLATVELRRRRQELTLAFSGLLDLFRLKPNTFFSIDFSKYGLDENTTFEVRDQTIFLRIEDDRPSFGVNIEARQLEAATFDLDLTNEQFQDNIEIPGLTSPFEVAPPGTPNVTEELFQTRLGAGVRTKAIVAWAASTDRFVVSYLISYRQVGNVDFIFLAETPDLRIEVPDLQPGIYDFQVQAINSVGFRSNAEDAQSLNVQIFGLSAIPDTPTNFRGQVIAAATILLRWNRSEDLDVIEGGFVEIRHDPAISGAVAKDSTLIDTDVGGQTSISVPFKQGTYFLRFQDSTGQFSDPADWSTQDRRPVAVAQIPIAGVLTDTGGFTIQEDNTFPSSNPGNTLIFVTDHLELPLTDTFDDVVDVDVEVDFDLIGGGNVEPEGFYFFSTDIELTTATRVLLEAVVATEVFDLSSSIDDEADFDQIPDVDQVAGNLTQAGLATAEIQVRFSNGTVASDTFGPWEPVDTSYFDNRSYQFRVRAVSTSPTVNIRVTQARIRMRAVPLG